MLALAVRRGASGARRAQTTLLWRATATRPALSRTAMPKLATTPTKRTFLAMPQGDALPVIGGLIGVNVAVWGGWKVADPRLMTAHFTLCNEDVLAAPHTLVTSAFSHSDGWHLLGNMVTLFFFGPEVVGAIGARHFLALEDSRRHAYWKRPSPRCLGASGAVNAAVAHSILLSPWRLIIIFAEFLPIPMPAILYGGAFLAKDLGPLLDVHIPYISDRAHGVAHGAHVGGTLVRFPASGDAAPLSRALMICFT
ncbi:RHOMBOID-like protein 12 [Aureococcus anophagefferens]|nr:RHOMBOID-like protein 12 [Aureococcus anophagefferens]